MGESWPLGVVSKDDRDTVTKISPASPDAVQSSSISRQCVLIEHLIRVGDGARVQGGHRCPPRRPTSPETWWHWCHRGRTADLVYLVSKYLPSTHPAGRCPGAGAGVPRPAPLVTNSWVWVLTGTRAKGGGSPGEGGAEVLGEALGEPRGF